MDTKKLLTVIKEVSVEAGLAILDVYHSCTDMQVEYKEGQMPLTAADKASNALIVERLKKEFPEYAILSEEEKDDRKRLDNPYCFVVDPLDGTKEFIKRNGQFTVNVALAKDHRTVLGVIYVPVTGELYYAAQDEGAFLSCLDVEKLEQERIATQTDGIVSAGQKAQRNEIARAAIAAVEPEKLSVSDRTEDLRVVMSSSHGCEQMDRLLEKYHLTNFVKIGSSLKGCLIAKGEAEVYYRYNPTMEWDTAAMQCIVEEAGAIFMQMDDTPMLYNRENSLNDKGFYIINSSKNKLEL